MSSVSEFIVDQSLKLVARQASQTDMAYGLMRALRRVRSLIDQIGGPITIPMLDSCLRNRIIIRSLRSDFARSKAGTPIFMPLPVPGPNALMAEELLTNAAESCLLCKRDNTEDGDIFLLVFILLDRMLELLQGVPDAMALLAELRGDEEGTSELNEPASIAPASVH